MAKRASPAVSVLMPMKNAERYVQAAVQSVLQQDFADLELIVVDDASTDGSRAVLEKVGDPRMRVIAGPARGIAAAWNAAFRAAAGEYILQCDADDLFTQDRIATQAGFLDCHPEYQAICGTFAAIEPSGRFIGNLCGSNASAEEITAELLGGVTRTHLGTFAIRRQAVELLGGKREFFEAGEDIDMQLRLADVGRIWFDPACAYFYRLHQSSITHTQKSERRIFFDHYARELCRQRRTAGSDDLARGVPRHPPATGTAAHSAARHMADILIGSAWVKHRAGFRKEALALGLRALNTSRFNLKAWKNMFVLIFKK